MVGGTTNTAQIYKAGLGRSENRFRFKKEENNSAVTHALEVSLDRADNIIEGAPPFVFKGGSGMRGSLRCAIQIVEGFCFPCFGVSLRIKNSCSTSSTAVSPIPMPVASKMKPTRFRSFLG